MENWCPLVIETMLGGALGVSSNIKARCRLLQLEKLTLLLWKTFKNAKRIWWCNVDTQIYEIDSLKIYSSTLLNKVNDEKVIITAT